MPTDNPFNLELYDEKSIDEEVRHINADIVEKLSKVTDKWTLEPQQVRDARKLGKGPFPLAPKSEHARNFTIPGPHGDILMREIKPQTKTSNGVYLYIHGGGWVLGAFDEHDVRLTSIAENCGLTCLSVEYRLSPENPYPVPVNDCEAATLWLAENAEPLYQTNNLSIGGESAGAHLATLALLRLRDKHGINPYKRVNLMCGCFDLTMTPSARNWGVEPLVLNTRDIEKFSACFVPDGLDRTDPDISPLYAELSGLPPALFLCGTKDALLDDTLFMSSRWAAAGNVSELALYPGGAHFFLPFECKISTEAQQRVETFLNTDFEVSS